MVALIHSGRHSAASLVRNTISVKIARRCAYASRAAWIMSASAEPPQGGGSPLGGQRSSRSDKRGGSRFPELRLRVVVFEEIDPQPHAQRQVLALREHGVDAVGRRRVFCQLLGERALRDFVLHLPRAA